MTDDSYFNIYEMKLSIISLFSVQIMSYLWTSDTIYSDVIDSFILEIIKYESSHIVFLDRKTRGRTIHTKFTAPTKLFLVPGANL